jgi:hypothetical protein
MGYAQENCLQTHIGRSGSKCDNIFLLSVEYRWEWSRDMVLAFGFIDTNVRSLSRIFVDDVSSQTLSSYVQQTIKVPAVE